MQQFCTRKFAYSFFPPIFFWVGGVYVFFPPSHYSRVCCGKTDIEFLCTVLFYFLNNEITLQMIF